MSRYSFQKNKQARHRELFSIFFGLGLWSCQVWLFSLPYSRFSHRCQWRESEGTYCKGSVIPLSLRMWVPLRYTKTQSCILCSEGNADRKRHSGRNDKVFWKCVLKKDIPGRAISGMVIPGRAISGRAISGRAISERAIPGRAISGRAIFQEETIPEESLTRCSSFKMNLWRDVPSIIQHQMPDVFWLAENRWKRPNMLCKFWLRRYMLKPIIWTYHILHLYTLFVPACLTTRSSNII